MQTGTSIIVRTDEGLKSFTQGDIDKRGVKIIRNGQPAQVSDFRDGDRLSATIITSLPPTIVTEKEVQATPSTTTASATPTGQASGAARTLPKTATARPMLGLASVLALAAGLALTLRRRYVS